MKSRSSISLPKGPTTMSRIPVQRRERFNPSNTAMCDLNYTILSIVKRCIEPSGRYCDHPPRDSVAADGDVK